MVEFVSYDGDYPSLCSGNLVLKINGKKRTTLSDCLYSGGNVSLDEDGEETITEGRWRIDLPEDLEPLRKEIEDCVNENIPHGCCGGCV